MLRWGDSSPCTYGRVVETSVVLIIVVIIVVMLLWNLRRCDPSQVLVIRVNIVLSLTVGEGYREPWFPVLLRNDKLR